MRKRRRNLITRNMLDFSRVLDESRIQLDGLVLFPVGCTNQIARDPRALVNGGQSRAWVRAAADEVDIFPACHTIARAQVEHLIKRVGQVKCSAHKDITLVSPVIGRDDALRYDVGTEVFHAGFRLNAADDFIAVFLLMLRPVEAMARVDRRHEHIES